MAFLPSYTLAEKSLAEFVEYAAAEAFPAEHWPMILRSGTTPDGHLLHPTLNYSVKAIRLRTAALAGETCSQGGSFCRTPHYLAALVVKIVEENTSAEAMHRSRRSLRCT